MSQMQVFLLTQLVLLTAGEVNSQVGCGDEACALGSDTEVLMQTNTKVKKTNTEVRTIRAGNPTPWTVNPAAFANTMTLTATVALDGVEQTDGYLFAFVGGECRGIASKGTVPPFPAFGAMAGKTIFPMMIYSNVASGETVTFKFHAGGENDAIDNTVAFVSDGNEGSATAPLALQATSPPPPPSSTWSSGDTDMAPQYENSMTWVVLVWLDGGIQGDGALAAFSGNVMRGKSSGANILHPPFGPWKGYAMHYMMVYGDSSGDELHFKYKKADGTVKTLSWTDTFFVNGKRGSAVSPFLMMA
jgi:hypothetical protein